MSELKIRIKALADQVFKAVEPLRPVQPFVGPLLDGALRNVSDEQIREALIQFRDKIIPWLLGDGDSDSQE